MADTTRRYRYQLFRELAESVSYILEHTPEEHQDDTTIRFDHLQEHLTTLDQTTVLRVFPNANAHAAVVCLDGSVATLLMMHKAEILAQHDLEMDLVDKLWGPPFGPISGTWVDDQRFVLTDSKRMMGFTVTGAVQHFELEVAQFDWFIYCALIVPSPTAFRTLFLVHPKTRPDERELLVSTYNDSEPNHHTFDIPRLMPWDFAHPWVATFVEEGLIIVGKDIEARCPVVIRLDNKGNKIFRCPVDLIRLCYHDGANSMFSVQGNGCVTAVTESRTRVVEWCLDLTKPIPEQLHWCQCLSVRETTIQAIDRGLVMYRNSWWQGELNVSSPQSDTQLYNIPFVVTSEPFRCQYSPYMLDSDSSVVYEVPQSAPHHRLFWIVEPHRLRIHDCRWCEPLPIEPAILTWDTRSVSGTDPTPTRRISVV